MYEFVYSHCPVMFTYVSLRLYLQHLPTSVTLTYLGLGTYFYLFSTNKSFLDFVLLTRLRFLKLFKIPHHCKHILQLVPSIMSIDLINKYLLLFSTKMYKDNIYVGINYKMNLLAV